MHPIPKLKTQFIQAGSSPDLPPSFTESLSTATSTLAASSFGSNPALSNFVQDYTTSLNAGDPALVMAVLAGEVGTVGWVVIKASPL